MPPKKIAVAQPVLDGNEATYVMECLEENWISSRGKFIERFENSLSQFLDVEDVVVTNNGTTALHLALAAMGVSAGDEVIMPTLSYVATANAVRYCGGTPVFVDCEPDYFSLDIDQVVSAITSKTKAIMTVPLYGHPVDIAAIEDVAKAYGLDVIEDAAEALGAEVDGRKVGSFGRCASFSFFGNKLITTGEGGAISTNDRALADRMRFLRGQAVDPQKNYWHPEVGFNYRMTNIAAAIGVAQMERIDSHLARRREVAGWYNEFLSPYQDVLKLPAEMSGCVHSYWMYSVMIRDEFAARDDVMQEMQAAGVETRPLFYPIHTLPCYPGESGDFPIAENCSMTGMNLPTHGRLSRSDVEYVSECLIQSIEKCRRSGFSGARAA